jgi:hypothetical protein
MDGINERMGRLPGRGGAERSLSCASSRSWQPPLAIPLPASGTGGNACCGAIRRGRDAGHDRHLFRVCGCWSLSWHGLLAAGRNALFVGSHCIAVCLFLHIRTCNIRFPGGSLRGKWAAKKASLFRNAGTYGYDTSVIHPAISGMNTLISKFSGPCTYIPQIVRVFSPHLQVQ